MKPAVAASLVLRNALTREGLRRILSDNGFEISHSTANVEELDAPEPCENHIILIDESVILDNPVGHITKLIAKFPGSKIVLLKEDFDFDVMSRAFAAGARGYILKDIPYQSFLAMMYLVSMGEKVVPSNLVDALQDRYRADALAERPHITKDFGLTEREHDILDCLVRGLPNKAISRDLGIGEATVKVAVKAIFRKLSVRNRTQAAIVARERGPHMNGRMRPTVEKFAAATLTVLAVTRVAFGQLPAIA